MTNASIRDALVEAIIETRVAVRSAQIKGLRVAGVGMVEGRKGPQVMEVNSSTGLEGIETATKLDLGVLTLASLAGD